MSANSEQRFGRYIGLVSWTLAALSIAAAAVKFYYSLCTASSTFADTPAMYLLFAGVFLLFYKLPSLIDRISSVKI